MLKVLKYVVVSFEKRAYKRHLTIFLFRILQNCHLSFALTLQQFIKRSIDV